MRVCTVIQRERYPLVIEDELQICSAPLDVGPRVFVQAGIDMWRAKRRRDAVRNGDARHLKAGCQIRRAVVDTWENVAVQIDHYKAPCGQELNG
jgi:hypothetical protein